MLNFAQYLFEILTVKVRNNETGRNRNNVVIHSDNTHKINGTAVDVGIILSTRGDKTQFVLEILNKDVIVGESRPTSGFADLTPVTHLREFFTVCEFRIELSVDIITRCKSDIMTVLNELVARFDDINRNYTVVAKELMLKSKYQELISQSNSDDVCFICIDKVLDHEKLCCGHHIHSHCLSDYIKNNDPEAQYRDADDDPEAHGTSFKCYCGHWVAAASWAN